MTSITEFKNINNENNSQIDSTSKISENDLEKQNNTDFIDNKQESIEGINYKQSKVTHSSFERFCALLIVFFCWCCIALIILSAIGGHFTLGYFISDGCKKIDSGDFISWNTYTGCGVQNLFPYPGYVSFGRYIANFFLLFCQYVVFVVINIIIIIIIGIISIPIIIALLAFLFVLCTPFLFCYFLFNYERLMTNN